MLDRDGTADRLTEIYDDCLIDKSNFYFSNKYPMTRLRDK